MCVLLVMNKRWDLQLKRHTCLHSDWQNKEDSQCQTWRSFSLFCLSSDLPFLRNFSLGCSLLMSETSSQIWRQMQNHKFMAFIFSQTKQITHLKYLWHCRISWLSGWHWCFWHAHFVLGWDKGQRTWICHQGKLPKEDKGPHQASSLVDYG